MSLSLLIVNWNSKDFLRICLRSVNKTCEDLISQTVVVDGGSFDGCGEMLAREFPEVEFVQCPDNIGFGRSNNLGFKRVKGEYLLLLNPDTEIKVGAVTALMTALRKLPAAGLVAPRLLNTDGSLQASCVQALPTQLNQVMDCEFLRRLFPRSRLWKTWKAFSSSEPVEVEAVSGACMLLRSETFRKLSGFTPDYFMYGEDMDFCAKIIRNGLKVYHIPKAEVVHHGGKSSKTQASQFNAVMIRIAGNTYMKLNHRPGSAFLYRLLQGSSAVARLSLLLLGVVFFRGKSRLSAIASFRKWWAVLHWSLGVSRIRKPVFEHSDALRISSSERL
jgi:N-acetylglucosaminyl-diphospho-decaprenol L-rhamnosyltransferase